MRRWTIILGASVAIVALAVGVIVLRPASRTRIDCRPVLESSTGKYKSLAKVDPDGYAYPLAAVKLEEGSRWELEIDDAYAGKSRTTDRSRISRLQQMRFGCTNSEIGTPETAVVWHQELRRGTLQPADAILGVCGAEAPAVGIG